MTIRNSTIAIAVAAALLASLLVFVVGQVMTHRLVGETLRSALDVAENKLRDHVENASARGLVQATVVASSVDVQAALANEDVETLKAKYLPAFE
ncbi:MAG: hypothetical protein AAFY59_15505, partial [Pseudomonadota bacterium]